MGQIFILIFGAGPTSSWFHEGFIETGFASHVVNLIALDSSVDEVVQLCRQHPATLPPCHSVTLPFHLPPSCMEILQKRAGTSCSNSDLILPSYVHREAEEAPADQLTQATDHIYVSFVSATDTLYNKGATLNCSVFSARGRKRRCTSVSKQRLIQGLKQLETLLFCSYSRRGSSLGPFCLGGEGRGVAAQRKSDYRAADGQLVP